jgi:hypothetical protein
MPSAGTAVGPNRQRQAANGRLFNFNVRPLFTYYYYVYCI